MTQQEYIQIFPYTHTNKYHFSTVTISGCDLNTDPLPYMCTCMICLKLKKTQCQNGYIYSCHRPHIKITVCLCLLEEADETTICPSTVASFSHPPPLYTIHLAAYGIFYKMYIISSISGQGVNVSKVIGAFFHLAREPFNENWQICSSDTCPNCKPELVSLYPTEIQAKNLKWKKKNVTLILTTFILQLHQKCIILCYKTLKDGSNFVLHDCFGFSGIFLVLVFF